MLNTQLITPNSTIIVGFSGGPDSVYLLHTLTKLQDSYNLTLIAAHLDHQWRPESAQEALWCKEFCQQRSITYITKKASDIEIKYKYNGSKEAYAHHLRRAFFKKIHDKYPQALVALAHHQDDQIETFFIRLARGTSLAGLTGIKEQDNYYIRPLLHISKHEIINYLNQDHISYLMDPTNQSLDYLRNRIRTYLTPQLTSIDKRFIKNITQTMHTLADTHDFLQQTSLASLNKISCPDRPYALYINDFLNLHVVIQKNILLYLLIQAHCIFTPSQNLFKEIIRFLKSNKHQTHLIHPGCTIQKSKNIFYIIQQ